MFSRKEKNVTLFYAKNENREDVYGFEEFFDVVKKHRDIIKPLYYEGYTTFNMLLLKNNP